MHKVSTVLICQIFLNSFGQSRKMPPYWCRMETSAVIHIFPHDLKEMFPINLLPVHRLPG